MINLFNTNLALPEPIVNNKKNRKRIGNLLQMGGLGFADVYNLVAGYLVFDHMIASIVGEGGVYLSCEGFPALFSIASLTPNLENVTRIETSSIRRENE